MDTLRDPSAAEADPAPTPDSMVHRGYYSISQAAELLGVSRVSIWRWIAAGRLPATRLGHRTTRIKREALEAALVQIGSAAPSARAGAPSEAASQTDDGVIHGQAPHGDWGTVPGSQHVVQFYETDAFLLDTISRFLGAPLRDGEAAIIVATPEHRAGVEARLRAQAIDLAVARANGRYVALDAAETLARFMVDGALDRERFRALIGAVIERARAGGRRVHIFGEMVALLALDGNHAGAVRLEKVWNELQTSHEFALFCAYPMTLLGSEALGELVVRVCAEHGAVIPAESYTTLPSDADRQRAITLLQQKACWLEAEIAERRQAEERLRLALASEQAARQTAEQALRLRDEFLSVAAHELRTPITSLLGYAQVGLRWLARDGQLDVGRTEQVLRTIAGQADKLSRLVNQLLDISRLDAGGLTLEREPTDVAQLVGRVVAAARGWSERHTIALEMPPQLRAEVDPLRLEQVLSNLLDNAIKYSPDGGPIEVKLAGTASGAIELSVRDHGLGIPPEKRGQVFERFSRAHSGSHRGGIGLGLSLSRQVVALHGGIIRAEFPRDGGSRFLVRLPAAA